MTNIPTIGPNSPKKHDPVKKFRNKFIDAKVIKFKKRVELINQKLEKEQDNFLNIVQEHYPYGTATLSDAHYKEFIEASSFLSTILSDIGYDSEFFAKIFNGDIDTLDEEAKFQKTLMCFLVNPEDRLNYRNLKYYLESLSCLDSEDRIFYKHLYDYIDFILDALIEALINGDYKINMDFFYLATSFKENETEEE